MITDNVIQTETYEGLNKETKLVNVNAKSKFQLSSYISPYHKNGAWSKVGGNHIKNNSDKLDGNKNKRNDGNLNNNSSRMNNNNTENSFLKLDTFQKSNYDRFGMSASEKSKEVLIIIINCI